VTPCVGVLFLDFLLLRALAVSVRLKINRHGMTNPESTVERLKAEATERWGNYWTIRVQHFADGDTNAFAFRSRRRDDDGNLVHDRLFILDSGQIVVERVTMERNKLDAETLEASTPTG
jgi:hypothetical protein